MGILFFFLKVGVKINVKLLVRRYLEAKEKRPGSDEKEFFALVLESRYAYERDEDNDLVFNYKDLALDLSRIESISDLIFQVISVEKRGLNLSLETQIKFDSMLKGVIDDQLKAAGV
jgi:hypothetical protein